MNNERLTSIIIPTYNGLHLLSRLVESIREHTDAPYEIIVVDNGSDDGTKEYCVREQLILISLPRNMGFPIACNKGLAASAGDQLLLLNNDCLVTPRWLSQLSTALNSADDIGIVGPVTNYASGMQRLDTGLDGPAELLEYARTFNRSNASKWVEVRRLIGYCFLFKRSLYDRIGPLDEAFSPGHYEDDDYCFRAVREGYRLLICGDTFIYHKGSASFKEKYPEGLDGLIEKNRKLFIDKWGIDPRRFMREEENP
ncbi:glycosyltransferase family 2 protein [Paenibacillus caui]|uniref:glycosyltransferase family 2 protein n=1 Tax=Paenibacillus caui TaxID=2873927 RepID=UPI001CA90D82|nr:glycosyltransferase family 2 protein [Paenibacillus caui]